MRKAENLLNGSTKMADVENLTDIAAHNMGLSSFKFFWWAP